MNQTSPLLEQVISEVVKRAERDHPYSLFLDFDGTLVPIAADPSAPRLSNGTCETLRRISSRQSCIVTIISGRAIDDLYTRIRLDGLVYAGNHGLEIRGRGMEFIEPQAAGLRERLDRLTNDVFTELEDIPGAFVENKGLSASIHYRQVAREDVELVEEIVRDHVAKAGACFRLNTGRKVFEIVPRTSWHKGAATRWINQHLGLEERLSIYLGDDATDEDAFSALQNAITIKVGGSSVTCANFQLPDPAAVHEFLTWLSDFEPATVVTELPSKSYPFVGHDRERS